MKKLYKIEVYLPIEALENIKNGLYEKGFGKIGKYENCLSWYEISSSWKPLDGATPYQGKVGETEFSKEYKLELRCNKKDIPVALDIIKNNHPYEEICINLVPITTF